MAETGWNDLGQKVVVNNGRQAANCLPAVRVDG